MNTEKPNIERPSERHCVRAQRTDRDEVNT